MAASLHTIILPSQPSTTEDNDTSIKGWDHSIITDDELLISPTVTATNNINITNCNLITYDVIALNNILFDTISTTNSEQDESAANNELCTLSNSITTIASTSNSNSNSKIIAVITKNNTIGNYEINLCNGNGLILATRAIGSISSATDSEEEREEFIPQLYFIPNNHSTSDSTDGEEEESNTLLVICPPSSQASNVIIITNLYTSKLNSTNDSIVKEGLSCISMDMLPLPSLSAAESEDNGSAGGTVKWMQGINVNSSTIRFFIQYANQQTGSVGGMAVADYNVATKKIELVLDSLNENIAEQLGSDNVKSGVEREIVGLGIDNYNTHQSLLVAFSGQADDSSKNAAKSPSTLLLWIDMRTLQIRAQYILPLGSWLLACSPVQSIGGSKYVAAAIASSDNDGKVEIHIVQSLLSSLDDELNMKNAGNDSSMVLFTITTQDTIENASGSVINLCSPPSSDDQRPYSFRYLYKTTSNSEEEKTNCFEFVPNEQEQLGNIQDMLVEFDYDGALNVLNDMLSKASATTSSDSTDNDLSRVHIPITKSTIALHQFQHLLSLPNTSSEMDLNFDEMKECLKQMAKYIIISSGTESNEGSNKNVETMCTACQFIMNWPMNQLSKNDGKSEEETAKTSIHQVITALTSMSTSLDSILQVIGTSSTSSTLLIEERTKIIDKYNALETISSILPSLAEQQGITINDPFLHIESIISLLMALVQCGAFKLVSCLIKHVNRSATTSNALTTDVIASSTLHIPKSIHPNHYISWLCEDTVIPSLYIGHPMLKLICGWVCNTVNYYDDSDSKGKGSGIDSSILLLKSVSKAIARLTVETMNKNYDYPMQYKLDTSADDGEAATGGNNNDTLNTSSSTSTARRSNSRPTVLNIGMISGMKRKDGRMMSAQRVTSSANRVNTTTNNTSLMDFSFFNNNPSPNSVTEQASFVNDDDEEEDEDESIEYDCVEIKLKNAIRLKKARSIGLDKNVLSLANYSSMGEQYIVKELVKMALSKQSSVSDDDNIEEEDEDLIDKIRTYALEVDANFDEAVQQYATELCSDNNHTTDVPQAIKQSQVLSQWVTDPTVKCTIVLQMLRRARVSEDCPPDLSKLAHDAISIAVNEEMKSKLVEDLKLLVIDTLVRKYCGNGAQDYFKVVEPSHCIKLVQHVIRHIDVPTVLEDVLVLTEAFTHVSKIDTCVSLLQRTMVAIPPNGSLSTTYRAEQCASFMIEIYFNDAILAERVGERLVAFCTGILEDCKKMILQDNVPEEAKDQAKVASSTSCSILAVMQDQVIQGERHSNIPKLLKEFQIISKMQSGCDIYLTIEELRNPASCASVVSDLLQPSVDLLRARSNSLNMEEDCSVHNELIPLVATARQWCDILCGTRSQQTSKIWSRAISNVASEVAKRSTNHGSLLLLAVSGLLDERNERSSFHAIMSVALTLCAKAFSEVKFISQEETDFSMAFLGMRFMSQASQLLNEHILLYSPSSMLSASLSLNSLIGLVCDVSVRSDMGIGTKLENYIQMLKTTSRKTRQHFSVTHTNKTIVNNMLADKRLPPAPNLHPTWYIGDGLLLPPLDALSLSMAYCKKMLEIESTRSPKSHQPLMEKNDIMRSLESRGAHSTSLRVLMLSTATSMSQSSNPTMFANAENMLKNNVSVLAERSLGGNESGLTSGNIDALMSVACLLHLPKEMAFKIYQAALPSAIGKRDFPRTLTLASVGTYCGVGTFPSGEKFPWSKQQRFIEQCDELSCNATWWSILSEHRVPFDPSVFSQSSAEQILNGYCKQLVQHATKKLGSRSTLTLARRFMKDYNLNKHIPTSAMIEYLLSSPVVDASDHKSKPDIRWDLSQTETAVKEYLVLLPTLNQNLVLRRCIMNLEKDDACSKDYDRHAMVLRLYLKCLDKLSSVMKKSDARANAHEEEMGRIERRQEAIAVISSAFEKHDSEKMPEYNKLFQPLPPDPSKLSKDVTKSNVLGADAEETVAFDPLAPLEAVLEDENGSNSIVAALAPLCSLLLLPSGYLHARSLIVRFRKLKASGSVLPSFDISVIPVIKKLKTPRDKADFCWWCSLQYNAGSIDQLKCLDIAHENSTLASEQAEYSKDPEEERIALERVKRVDAARAGLSDKILVDEVLERHESTPKSIKKLYKSIIDKVQQQAVLSENYSPEHLVQALLLEGSLTVAEASLNNTDGFATHHFRLLALMVHDACKSLSNRYSHVNVGSICRLLTRRFLVHGDDVSEKIEDLGGENDNVGVKKNESDLSTVKEEDDEQTSEFVMDMSLMSSGNQTWSNDIRRASGGITSSTHTHESSALSPSSPRETSDNQCGRVSLRVAFMICFSEDYHCRPDSPPSSEKKGSLKRRSNSSKIREGDLALQHARELLGIAFARQGSTVASTYGFLFGDESSAYDTSILSTVPEDDTKEDHYSKSKAVSFAMRHRALRVATILCPQDLIKRVIVEEMYANDFGDDHLNKCAFASFVAKEIEAMSLSLPHSGLIELSTMHFPSYARTLWRNHGSSMSSPPLSGRLHLLLLELCINHQENVDWELFMLVFSELERLELPRSLLLACECAVESRAVSLAASQERIDMLQVVESATKKIVGLIVSEVETQLSADMDVNLFDYVSTLHRIVSVINTDGMHEDPTYFVDALGKLSERCLEKGQEEAADVFTDASVRTTSYLTDSEIYSKAKSFATKGRHADEEDVGQTPFLNSVCSEAIQAFEGSFH